MSQKNKKPAPKKLAASVKPGVTSVSPKQVIEEAEAGRRMAGEFKQEFDKQAEQLEANRPLVDHLKRPAEQVLEGQEFDPVKFEQEQNAQACTDAMQLFYFLGTLGSGLVDLHLRLRTEELMGNVVPWECRITLKHPRGSKTFTMCDPHPGKAILLALVDLREQGGSILRKGNADMRRVFKVIDEFAHPKKYWKADVSPYLPSMAFIDRIQKASADDLIKAEDKKFLDDIDRAG